MTNCHQSHAIMSRCSNVLYPPSVFFIDFEAFQHGAEDFSIKELCVIDMARPMKQLYYLYLPPCSWDSLNRDQKRSYSYEYLHLHKLSWDEGYARFCAACLRRDMQNWLFPTTNRETSVFYVMGRQKADYLQRLLPDLKFVNYQEAFNVASLKELCALPSHVRCIHRVHGEHCAMLKCYRMYMHFMSL